jgi:hypothetical protein
MFWGGDGGQPIQKKTYPKNEIKANSTQLLMLIKGTNRAAGRLFGVDIMPIPDKVKIQLRNTENRRTLFDFYGVYNPKRTSGENANHGYGNRTLDDAQAD